MSLTRCPQCRTICDGTHRFCWICGAEMAGGRSIAQIPVAMREGRRDLGAFWALFGVFGILGSAGIAMSLLSQAPSNPESLIVLLGFGGVVALAMLAAWWRNQELGAVEIVIKGFARIGMLFALGAIVMVGLLVFLFVTCATMMH